MEPARCVCGRFTSRGLTGLGAVRHRGGNTHGERIRDGTDFPRPRGQWREAVSRSWSGQPPRADRRGNRHRQDSDAARIGGELFCRRCPGIRGRCEGRPVGRLDAGFADVQACRQARRPGEGTRHGRLWLFRQSGDFLGSVWRAGPSDPHHGFGNGAAAFEPPARSQRYAGRRVADRLPPCRRERAAAARFRRFAVGARLGVGKCQGTVGRLWQCQQAERRHDPAPVAEF